MRTRRFILPLLAGLLVLVHFTAVRAQDPAVPLEDSQFPSLESAIRVKGPLTFCGEFVPLHLPGVREGLEKELLIMLWDRAQVILWLKRSARYFPHIRTMLASADMPDDLKYIAVIESALKPEAGSRRGARGIWQFIPTTARNHGLTVSRYIDERRNFYLATAAAVRYFRILHERFNSWTLACAAYNMGEEGLEKRMGKQEVKDYYHLDLPRETERYILRAVAAKLILSDPARYGFRLIPEDYYRPRKFDRVRLKHGHAAPVLIVAKAAGTYYKTVKELNPQILSDVIPPGDNVVFLPEGASKGFAERYQPLIVQYRKKHRGKTYTVRKGDSLSLIADKNGMPLWKLLKLNNLVRNSVIRPGQKLVIMK
ncbi:transglycosylase SLT domain-containing protein [Pseudodesulfovibrio cashew]|uniref:Transglycosylase SLT domain-containing protein n=1 Tax=Pseudodesulfovibrio cashew TaxID=2678688 RepID=A0A6I6JQ08_9BACT|nr:lytic transglycosylase domain-containing protein [Pseudodesulfovibrio cashew]QGY39734.1 transglycosylase SLT domain-containing protein [Pseudodesulfovibrio cashew]